jgi:hypothetical protein
MVTSQAREAEMLSFGLAGCHARTSAAPDQPHDHARAERGAKQTHLHFLAPLRHLSPSRWVNDGVY